METELKLMLDRQGYEFWLQSATIRELRQVNHYFNLAEFENMMLRIREKEETYELTLKVSELEKAGVFVNREMNYRISQADFSEYVKNGISTKLLNQIYNINLPLHTADYLGSLTTYRSIVMWKDVKLELDKNEYFDVVDYEIECESDDLQTLEEIKEMLKSKCVCSESRPKFERFYRRLQKGEK